MVSLIEDPVMKQRLSFQAADDGAAVLVEMWVEPGGGVPAHVHPSMEERFEVISGELSFLSGRKWRTAAAGDFATVMRKGDEDRGSLLLIVTSRGRHVACLEREMGMDGLYRWTRVGPAESAGSVEMQEFLRKRARFDEDSWAIELDIAEPERFIAETTLTG